MRTLILWASVAVSLSLSLCCVQADDHWTGPIPKGLGVNIHFTDPKPGEIEMLAAGGFEIVRMDFGWGGIERKKGEYDFAAYERLLKRLDENHLRALFILDYGNRHYDNGEAPRSEEGRAAFTKFAVASLKHFRGRNIVWELWNEPNIQFWKPKPDVNAYIALCKEVGAAIRADREIAHEIFVGPATSEVKLQFIQPCCEQGCLAFWDAVSVHPYRQDAPKIGWEKAKQEATVEFNHSGDPESVVAEYAKLKALIAQHAPSGKSLPILSGEWGYSANHRSRGGWRAYDDDRQGQMLPRQWLVNMSAGVPISIWYDWHDDGEKAEEPEHHFGTVRFPYRSGQTPVYEPKPAYRAAQTLTATLHGYQFEKNIKFGENDEYVLQFQQPHRTAWAVWTTRATRKATLPIPTGQYAVVSHVGERREVTVSGQGLEIELTNGVQYIVPAK